MFLPKTVFRTIPGERAPRDLENNVSRGIQIRHIFQNIDQIQKIIIFVEIQTAMQMDRGAIRPTRQRDLSTVIYEL